MTGGSIIVANLAAGHSKRRATSSTALHGCDGFQQLVASLREVLPKKQEWA